MFRCLTTAILITASAVTADHARAADVPIQKNGKEAAGRPSVELDADRLEVRLDGGSPLFFWDVESWFGGGRHRLWFKTEGVQSIDGGSLEAAELQALYSYAVGRFFNLQAGIRHDFGQFPTRTFGVLSIEGLEFLAFKTDAALFLSEDGDLSASIEAEYDVNLARRLIVQPRAQLDFALQRVRELGVGSGLGGANLSVRLRYQMARELAPYIGVSWLRAVGETASFARADGVDVSSVSFVAGLHIWY